MPTEKTTIVEEEIVDIFQEGTYDIPLYESSHDTNNNITGKIEPKFKSSNVINQCLTVSMYYCNIFILFIMFIFEANKVY